MKRRFLMLGVLIVATGILRIAENKTAVIEMAAGKHPKGVKMELEGRPVPIYPMADSNNNHFPIL
jgi:hypothetical protein